MYYNANVSLQKSLKKLDLKNRHDQILTFLEKKNRLFLPNPSSLNFCYFCFSSSGAGESNSPGSSSHLVCKEEQQSIFRYCEG
jgi:hypothetical protein